MKKWLIRVLLLALWSLSLVYAYGLGGLAAMHRPEAVKRSAAMAMELARLVLPRECQAGDTTACGFADTRGREEIDCARFSGSDRRTAVLFTFGQSNSANAGSDRYMPKEAVFNFNPHDGRCYRAMDPLLGPNGHRGSVWGVLGDLLVSSGAYDRVLIAPFGIGATSIQSWVPGGELHPRVVHTAQGLARHGIRPTHVLWHQGESDANRMDGETYTAHFQQLAKALRGYGITAPIYPAVTTVCVNEGDPEIRAAQATLPNMLKGVEAGPDTDTLRGEQYRYDRCHFSAQGMQAHARLWLQAMQPRP